MLGDGVTRQERKYAGPVLQRMRRTALLTMLAPRPALALLGDSDGRQCDRRADGKRQGGKCAATINHEYFPQTVCASF